MTDYEDNVRRIVSTRRNKNYFQTKVSTQNIVAKPKIEEKTQ